MRNYLIIVEGAHDIAVLEKLLHLNGVKQSVRRQEDLPAMWNRTIPEKFPFHENRLERITPVPTFVKNEDITVAIKNANSDTEIITVLQQLIDIMSPAEKNQLDGVMLLFDADKKTATEKRKKVLKDYREKGDFKLEYRQDSIILDVGIKKLPVSIFVFPDNEGEGSLEHLLLETAETAYPDLLSLAEDYVRKAKEFEITLDKEQNANKAIVGCIANAMKPGKANQVSIHDNDWISEQTLEACHKLRKLNVELRKMIFQ